MRAKYTGIIDGILSTSDLTTISEKKIRKGIQEAVEYDITPQKVAWNISRSGFCAQIELGINQRIDNGAL